MLRNGIQSWHVIVLLIVVLLLFGAKRLPDVAKSVGQSLKIFKSEVKDLRTDDAPLTDPPNTPPAAQNTVVPPPVVVQTPVVTPDRPEPTEGSAPPKA
ncbi:Sec-independent protein translocase subunit TatA [Cellulomonas sp. URHE0023]|uniref:Sec-independent protein translocase subunit TatA n=1 Tax=Cellulomonas sp. URHE0023 TaxID=1380354 RepID=UPI00054F68C4|nr:Sec-independent protein translocase subunit TatA [Cellulomonas sp. URHE0023]